MYFNKVKKIIKSADLFSKNVKLNFNKNEDTFTTFVGGIASIAIIFMFLILGFIKGKKLIKREDP